MKKQNSRPTPVQVIVTDTHVNTENYPLIIDIFQQFIDLIKSLGLNTGIHMGDFFTSRASQSLMCLLTTTLILDMFEKEEITLYIIPGNHDKTDLESEESYLTIFNNRTYVTLFEKESFIDDNGINYCFLPYFKEGTEYLQRLSNLNEMVGNFMLSVLFTHISINGVRNNDGSVVDGDVEADFFMLAVHTSLILVKMKIKASQCYARIYHFIMYNQISRITGSSLSGLMNLKKLRKNFCHH
jgi:DNA repair exonuclease SbcCD nuclease subunit